MRMLVWVATLCGLAIGAGSAQAAVKFDAVK
jgi:hypothetical protein